jgi:membrane fusion protein, multidrug efflux system
LKHEDFANSPETGSDLRGRPAFKDQLLKVKALAIMLAKKVPTAAWVLFAAYVVYKVLIATAPTITPAANEERSWPISTIAATYADARPEIMLFGEVVAGREVEMRSLVSGQVVDVGPNFHEGGLMAAGELLVQVDPFEYKAALDDAKAKRREARARLKSEKDGLVTEALQLDLSQRDYDRARRLHEKGTVSRKFLDDSELAYSRAQQSVTALGNRIEMEAARLQQHDVAVRRAERNLENTILRAPFEGFVGEISAALGKRVGVNDRIAQFSESEQFEARFNVTDAQYGRILSSGEKMVGRKVVVTWKVGGTPLEYTATIERVGAQIEAQSGGIDVYALLDDKPDSTAIRPGAFVEIRFPDRLYHNVVQLPEATLFGGKIVYAVVDGRLIARPVTVLGYTGDDIFVTGKELQDGEPILTTRFAEIGEGVLVNVRD